MARLHLFSILLLETCGSSRSSSGRKKRSYFHRERTGEVRLILMSSSHYSANCTCTSLGVWHEFQKDQRRPPSEWYIHHITTSDSGGRIIFTIVPDLIALIHDATQFQGNGTFKRVAGPFDEYEITIWHHASSQSRSES